MAEPGLGTPLDEAVLARRQQLPLKPDAVTLTGEKVQLRPLDLDRDLATLYAFSNGEPATLGNRSVGAYDPERLIWRYMQLGPFDDAAGLGSWLQGVANTPNTRTLTVVELSSGQPLGTVSFMSNMPEHLKIELGSIWYSPLAQRTGANTEATYLMLKHAFGLGYRRLEWKCDSNNARSRKAALSMGFKFEGIQEGHFITKGRNRDTAWFRIMDREWPAVQEMLERKLARFTA
jgi:RimJ/RimL family protein N-acetyltransferase